MTAACSKICENGGRCAAAERCLCPAGWTGEDCTTAVCSPACSWRKLCTAPNTCTCIPGWTGALCLQPQCSQPCINGDCTGPDACTCRNGWFGPNCTVPVCDQTCGNGGNCTAPRICRCPTQWTGQDCRTPVCTQGVCANGGECVAPDTCRCSAGWSGYKCEMPVCAQGMLRPEPRPQSFAPAGSSRILSWFQTVLCNFTNWCTGTGDVDCRQPARTVQVLPLNFPRSYNGFKSVPDACYLIELNLGVSAGVAWPYRAPCVTRSTRR